MSFAAGWPGTNNRRDHQYNTGWRMWLAMRPTNRKNKIKRLFNVSR
jgi:hypothetical protein